MSPQDDLADLIAKTPSDDPCTVPSPLKLADAILAAGYVKPDASSEARDTAIADDNDPDYWRRVYIIGVDERVRLEDRLREAREALQRARAVVGDLAEQSTEGEFGDYGPVLISAARVAAALEERS